MTTAKQLRQQFINQQQPLAGLDPNGVSLAGLKAQPERPAMDRAAILNKAADIVCNDREATHGTAQSTFDKIADMWTITVGVPVEAKQVALMMAQLKMIRILEGDAAEPDHWIDICGYSALGAEIAGQE